MTTVDLEPVTDPHESKRASARLSEVLQRTATSFCLVKVDGWVAMPLERSMHLSPPTRERVVERLRAQASEGMYAISYEVPGVYTPIFRVRASMQGLMEFDRECGQLNCVLCTENFCGFVLCSASGDYLATVGTQEFVEAIAGKSLLVARHDFEQFADDPAWTPHERALFRSVVTILCEEYAATTPGAAVEFPRT